jgi:hypothetical protein
MHYIICGFGTFGKLAYERLQDTAPDAAITIVDPHPTGRVPEATSTITVIRDDAVSYLAAGSRLDSADMVLPMTRFHLAAAYISRVSPLHGSPWDVPQAVTDTLPNPLVLDSSTVCCSLADFLCPDDCPEGATCTVTGEPRDDPLFQRLARISTAHAGMLVQRSYQILPGIGGYPFGELRALAQTMGPGKWLVATACKCHGIVSGVEFGLAA